MNGLVGTSDILYDYICFWRNFGVVVALSYSLIFTSRMCLYHSHGSSYLSTVKRDPSSPDASKYKFVN
jgi:hypothetical protein